SNANQRWGGAHDEVGGPVKRVEECETGQPCAEPRQTLLFADRDAEGFGSAHGLTLVWNSPRGRWMGSRLWAPRKISAKAGPGAGRGTGGPPHQEPTTGAAGCGQA